MARNNDRVALSWVQQEVTKTLEKARLALESYFEQDADESQLSICISGLHQVKGTLEILDFMGAVALAAELENLGIALQEKKLEANEQILEIYMSGILQLTLYLQKIQSGQQDQLFLLLPVINEVRKAQGLEELSGEDFLPQPGEITPPKPAISFQAPQTDNEFVALTKKLRHHFQRGLLGIIKQDNIQQSLQRIHKVLERLDVICYGHSVSHLWWIADGFVATLNVDEHYKDKSAQVLLGQIDRQIKRLAEVGQDALDDEVSDTLLHNLVDRISNSKAESTRISQIRQAFAMDAEVIGTSETAFAGAGDEAMETAAEVLKENIENVKDSIDLYVRNKEATNKDVAAFIPQLKQVADTLNLLGLSGMRSNLLQQMEILQKNIDDDVKVDDGTIMDIAGALLLIEASLSDLRSAQLSHSAEEAEANAQESEYLQAQYQFVREARVNLQRAQDAIVDFMASGGDQDAISEVPIWLNDTEGGFNILMMPQLQSMLRTCRQFVEDKMLGTNQLPGQREFDALADVLTSAEYYLEGFDEAGIQSMDSVLDASKNSLRLLEQFVKDEVQAETVIETGIEVEAEEEKETVTSAEELTETETDHELIDDEIIEIFIEEAEDELQSLEQTFPRWRVNPEDTNALTITRRSFHTLKGSGRLVGATTIGELAWKVENLLNKIINSTVSVNEEIYTAIAEVIKLIPELINKFKTGAQESSRAEQLAEQCENLATQSITPVADIELPKPVSASEQIPIEEITADLETVEENEADISEEIATVAASDEDLDLEQKTESEAEKELETEAVDFTSSVETTEETVDVADDSLSEIEAPIEFSTDEISLSDELEIEEISSAEPIEFATEAQAESMEETPLEEVEPETEAVEEPLDLEAEAAKALEALASQTEETIESDLSLETAEDIEKVVEEQLQQVAEENEVEEISSEPVSLDPVLAEIFETETRTHLEAIDKFIQEAALQSETLASDDVVRALHTIKGSANMAGAGKVANLVAPVEKHFRQLNGRIIAVSEDALDLLKNISNYLKENISEVEALENNHSDETYINLLTRSEGLEALIPLIEVEEESSEGDAIINFLGDAQDFIDDIIAVVDNWKFAPENKEAAHPVIIALTTISARAGELNFEAISLSATHIIDLLNRALEPSNLVNDEFFELLQKGILLVTDNLDRIAANQRPKVDENIFNALDEFVFTQTETETETETEQSDEALVIEEEPDTTTPDTGAADVEEKPLAEELESLELSAVDETEEEQKTQTDEAISVEETEQVVAVNEAEETEDVETEAINEALEEDKAQAEEQIAIDDGEEVTPLDLDPEDLEILDIYLDEARELIEEQEDTLQLWEEDLSNQQHLQLLLRQLHTLKGGARLSGVHNLADLSHELETLFESVVTGRRKADTTLLELANVGRNRMESMLDEITKNARIVTANKLIAQLKAYARGEDIPAEKDIVLEKPVKQKAEKVIPENVINLQQRGQKTALKESKKVTKTAQKQRKETARKLPQVREMIRVGSETLEGLVNLAGETSIYRSRLEQQVTNFRFNLEEIASTVDRVKTQIRNLEIETDAQVQYRQEQIGGQDDEDFDPLEMDRYTRQQEMTRSLGESTTDLISLKETLDSLAADAEVLLLQQSRVDSELQDRLMKTRLVPFSSVVPRLRRMVRQISDELKKKVQLSIQAEGEMDRTVLERLIPPIEHMLRNAMDHGIEAASKRKKAKKPVQGRILIRLFREGSEVVVEVIDDGRGIDLAAVRNKAVERGLITPDADLTDHELQLMILEAGFSTAEEVTQISGRGVGMDVVNSDIKQMGGHIDINSVPGKGSTFTVRLPFTVSVNQALMVSNADDLFAIPLTNIEGIVRISPYELMEYYQMDDPEFLYAGDSFQLRYLGKLLDTAEKPKLDGVTQPVPLLLLHGVERPVALQVDELLGSREIVVKSLGQQLSSISGVSGATILGDGSVVLILELPALLRRIDAPSAESDYEPHVIEEHQEEEKPVVMVVDDSITVRKVTSRLLERNNFEVITAKDGVDAVSVLGDKIPDVMLLDIEMPRMDGFELATIIRHDENYKNIPIIMITSRTGDKHQKRAKEIGVDQFMGKPFNEIDLLNKIEDLLD